MQFLLNVSIAATFLVGGFVSAADYQEAAALFRQGDYYASLAIAEAEVERGVWNERWPRLLIECQLTMGRYADAQRTYEAAIERYSSSIPLRLMGGEVYRFNNQPARAEKELEMIMEIVRRSPWRYSDKENLIAIGRYFLQQGEDAKQVLELFFDRARNTNSTYVDAFIATGELALLKNDFALAAKELDQAAKLDPDDPRIAFLQAEAWQSSDSEKAAAMLQRALQLNPNHVDSLLSLAEQAIDAEQFDDAEQKLTQALSINPYHPEAWAYHAVIAHLQGHFEAERMLRKAALSKWESNPNVDHWIGNKLSRHYRFAEAAEYQRRALRKREDFVDAKFQLAQDLLRIGQDEAGWQLADEVFAQDQYNVVAHNLVQLHDSIKAFATLEAPGFLIRMDAREARIYGAEVVALLTEARQTLTEKYDIELEEPTIVEIFPQQKDFAIRTFGLPGGDGFLGVCFGRLITANSPASQSQTPANWKAVLWHEFCHVVTLQKTKNRMPRWLSEGISVYEELQRDKTWGQSMSPTYRGMLLGDSFTPLSELSSAFMRPKSALHLQFAYYESSLAVAFLVEKHGLDVLKKILADLAIGMSMNEALERYIGSLEVIDQQFADYAHEMANRYGKPEAWLRDEEPVVEVKPDDPFAQILAPSPTPFDQQIQLASEAIRERNWEQAIEGLESVAAWFDDETVPIQVLSMQARVYREQQADEQERAVLKRIAERTSDAVDAYRRLIDLSKQAEQWDEVAKYAAQYSSVNPLHPDLQQTIAESADKLEQHEASARARQALLEMNPVDPAGLHFQLAQSLLAIDDQPAALRHVLLALEIAPRYRDAHRLLLRLTETSNQNDIQGE
ncbi:MAG: tetratricopeptide repeat protein [Pirellulaceae bacterium]